MRALLLLLCTGLLACADPCEPVSTDARLTWVQLALDGSIGEAALIVGPTGRTALIDAGNDSHADAVLAAVQRWTGGHRVDVLVATHFHADHIGGLSALAPDLEVGALISRGLVDLQDANASELEGLGALVEAGTEHRPLCDEAGCPGLDEPVDLGGPTIHWLAANARDRQGPLVEGELEENARSVVGVLRWGDFDLLFGGDLTGGGKGTPDVETPLAARAPASLWPVDGVEVLQANHHGIRSSTNDAWLDRAFAGGGDRQWLVGAGPGYAAAPHQDLLDAVAPRLGGGRIWASGTGSLAGTHERLTEAEGDVAIIIEANGAYVVRAGQDGTCGEQAFSSSRDGG